MKSQRAFTLIEVLVALIIVALGMGAALKALTSAADSTARLREKTFAAWVGFNQLATTRLGTGIRTTGSQEAEVDFAGFRWHWQQTTEDMEVQGLKRITIRVRHADQTDKLGGAKRATAPNEDWLATVVGFRGDSLQFPQSELAGWDDAGGGQQRPTPTPTTSPTPSFTPSPAATPTH